MLKDLKVGIIRWLEPKPCGAFLNETAQLIEEEDRAILNRLYTEYNTLPAYRDYPMIVYDAYAEAPEHLGCLMAGHSLLYINSSGEVQPCVFLPITFGNILREDITAILKRMRLAVPVPLHTACPSIQLNASIRNKLDHGIPVPIPYEGIKMEFDSLIT
jgi:MoaA/NifB/PqqE/SkfB family radical SAM enzyme